MQALYLALFVVLLAVVQAERATNVSPQAAAAQECSSSCDAMKLDVLTLAMCRYVLKFEPLC